MTQFILINLGRLTARSLAFLPQPHQTNKKKSCINRGTSTTCQQEPEV